MGAALAAILPVTAVASRTVDPIPIEYGEPCFSCQRPITDRFTAAEAVALPEDGSGAYKFRTVRCMLAFIDEMGARYDALYVADYRDGTLLNVDNAVFVPIDIDVATGAHASHSRGESSGAASRGGEGADEPGDESASEPTDESTEESTDEPANEPAGNSAHYRERR
jgi:hypothetical protein